MKQGKNLGLDIILEEIKVGLNPAQISKKHSIPKQTISYNVDKLKKLGCMEKVGYGSWRFIKEVPNQPKDTKRANSDFKEIRGHAFIWSIEFLEGGYNWEQIAKNHKKKYKNSSLTFKWICNKKVQRIIFKNKKIWLTKKGLAIYEPLDFFGKSSCNVKGSAVYEMDRTVKALIKKLNLKTQYYKFKCSREHFAHVKNQMARQFNENKQKIKVEHDGKWFWIDHSHGEHEEETNDPNVSVQAQKFYKSQMKTDFKITPEVIAKNLNESAKQIKKNADNLDYHAENMRSHVQATKDLSEGIKIQNKLFERITKALEEKKK